jgi:hypothetical protein
MRLRVVDQCIFLVSILLIWFFFEQASKLSYAEETIQLQHDAILKQNEYIEAQKRYIQALELQDNSHLYRGFFQSPPKSQSL